MIFVSYCRVDEQAVMVKFHHTFTCTQPKLDSLCLGTGKYRQSGVHVGVRKKAVALHWTAFWIYPYSINQHLL